jgi:hypothetical protein
MNFLPSSFETDSFQIGFSSIAPTLERVVTNALRAHLISAASRYD